MRRMRSLDKSTRAAKRSKRNDGSASDGLNQPSISAGGNAQGIPGSSQGFEDIEPPIMIPAGGNEPLPTPAPTQRSSAQASASVDDLSTNVYSTSTVAESAIEEAEAQVPNAEKAELYRLLNRAASANWFTDLHTHLLGMGSADFWVSRIMVTYLSSVKRNWKAGERTDPGVLAKFFTELIHAQLELNKEETKAVDSWVKTFTKALKKGTILQQFNVHDILEFSRPTWDELVELKESDRTTMLECFGKYYTDDVVFTKANLLDAVNPPPSLRNEPQKLAFLESVFSQGSRSKRPFKEMFRQYLIFNARGKNGVAQFELVTGITNSDLLELMELGENGEQDHMRSDRAKAIEGVIRNGFSMLNADGSQPDSLNAAQVREFRGCFTPEFYPRRFALKDCIYSQRLEVLGILINNTAGRYGKSGVIYVEYSVGVNDMLNLNVWKHLTESVFSGSVEGSSGKPKKTQGRSPIEKKKNEEEGRGQHEHRMEIGQELLASGQHEHRMEIGQELLASGQHEHRMEIGQELLASGQHEHSMEIGQEPSASGQHEHSMDIGQEPSASEGSVLSELALCSELKNLKPRWRRHMGAYEDRKHGFTYRFLAAFNRTKVHVPQVLAAETKIQWTTPTICDSIKGTEFLESFPDQAQSMYASTQDLKEMFAHLFETSEDGKGPGDVQTHFFNSSNFGLNLITRFQNAGLRLRELVNTNVGDIDLDSCSYSSLKKTNKGRQIRLLKRWIEFVVGLDWVGDEAGFPYCAFVHPDFLDIFRRMRELTGRTFGARIHGGESVPRPASICPDARMAAAYKAHMHIVCDGILRTYEGLKGLYPNDCCFLRIGHGVAFLNTPENETALKEKYEQILDQENNIVLELNMTSNAHLLTDSNHHETESSSDVGSTVAKFISGKLRVVLSTDDDGVWPIRKCKPHYHHITVPGEFCMAIAERALTNKEDLKRVIEQSFAAAFTKLRLPKVSDLRI
ncbi:hypothetical protein BC832DRAFT_185908 [Gaertneriomyces semiglobifer]|nr:hypothetical protein BC832DRAFT_185908 [Gaertneriomyces semiglobifer]